MLNRVNRVLLTNVEAANTGTNLATIINGDMLIFNKTWGTALTGTPTVISAEGNDTIFISQGIGSGRRVDSLPIVLKNVTKVTVRGYAAPAEKVMTFGHNGTSGTISTPSNSTEYFLNILIKDDQRIHGNRPTRQFYSYVTDASATAKELAFAFAQKIENDCLAINTNSYVTAVVLLDTATYTALTNNATVTQFGKTITSTAHGLAAGDFVRIGGVTGASPVYQVDTIVDANNFTIKGRYMGATGTVLAANIGVVTGDTSVGLQITGRSIAYNGIDLYQKVDFDASLAASNAAGFAVLTTPVVTTALAYGQGYWQQVRDAEYFAQGYAGITNRIQFPGSITNPATRAVEGNTYNSVVIEHYSEEETSLQKVEKKPMTTEIYFYSASAPTASTKQTAFLGILESLVESVGVRVQ